MAVCLSFSANEGKHIAPKCELRLVVLKVNLGILFLGDDGVLLVCLNRQVRNLGDSGTRHSDCE
jgi:hypothetical protein